MRSPGFTAEAALAGRRAGYRLRPRAQADHAGVSPQRRYGECSDGSPALCYFCDDSDGCYCDWYYGGSYIVSTDCGGRR